MSFRTHSYAGVICPRCEHLHQDSWEWNQDDMDSEGSRECDKCGMGFDWFRKVIVSYEAELPESN